MRRKRNTPICRHAELQRLAHNTTSSLYTGTLLVTCVSRVSFVALICIDVEVCVPSCTTVGLAVTARFVCLCSCCHTKLFLRVRNYTEANVDYIFTAILCYGAEYSGILCVCVCVCVCVRACVRVRARAIALDFCGLHSLLLSLHVFLLLFSDLLLISHKEFSDWLVN